MDSLVVADRSARDPHRCDALVTTVRAERGRAAMRRRLTFAACLVVLMAAAGVLVSGRFDLFNRSGPQETPITSAAPKLHAVSQQTGTDASVQVDAKKWGSE